MLRAALPELCENLKFLLVQGLEITLARSPSFLPCEEVFAEFTQKQLGQVRGSLLRCSRFLCFLDFGIAAQLALERCLGSLAVTQSHKQGGCGVRILLVAWCVATLKQCLRAALVALPCCLQKGCSVHRSATEPQHLMSVQLLIPDPVFAYWHLLMNVSFVTRCYQEPTHPPAWECSRPRGRRGTWRTRSLPSSPITSLELLRCL